uniref:Adenylate kinase 7 n=1 Tax=Haptolina brevifila TaxID=156173 RepID=A0A7S2FPT0_9EUKA
MEAAESMLTAIAAAGPLESEKVLVGISSVLTWARTSPDADEPEKPITEADYKKRRPHSSYKELLALEKLVTKSKREGLRAHVVAAGLLYGAEEDIFHDLFKAAWSNKPLPLLTLNDGSNVLPTIHINDLCSITAKLLEVDSLPYLLAVDSPADEEKPQTFAAIVQALSTELGTGTVLPAPARPEVLLMPDYEFFQVGTAIGDTPGLKLQAAAINELGFEWHAEGGLLACMPTVVQEYRESRGLQPLRLIVHGNDEVAKTELTEALAQEYKLPCLHVSKVLDAATLKEDELGAELAAARAAGPVSDELTAKVLGAALSTVECRNQGYILQGFPENCAQAALLFGSKVEAEGEEAPPEEAEEGAEASTSLASAPEFVIVLEADEAVIKEKLFSQDEPSMTEEQLTEMLAAYTTNNSEDSPTSVLALPALAQVEPLGPIEVRADTAVSSILSKARVYLGQPRNYGPSDEEIAAKKALEEAEAKRKADEETAAEAAREAAELEERKRREEHESRRAAEVQQQEHELLEVRSIPLRNYLMQNVIPTLTEGLIEVCKLKPEDPVDYLAEYLFKNNPVEDEQFD